MHIRANLPGDKWKHVEALDFLVSFLNTTDKHTKCLLHLREENPSNWMH